MSWADGPTRIWNRACDVDAETGSLRVGDVALRNAILFDAVLQNGGLEHALEVLGEAERRAAADGFRHLGLDEAADVLTRAGAVGGDEEELERLEDAYYEHGGDDKLDAAFQRLIAEHPEQFAPVD